MRSVKDKKGARGEGRGISVVFKIITSLFILFYSLFSIELSAQDIKLPERPDPPRLVNDMAGMLSAGEVAALENKLVAYDDSTSTQIAIVTINSLDGAERAQYATELATKWGIGRKGKDNGILLLISKGDHKMFIATGRGVEANLPDVIAEKIIQKDLRPQFKAGQYYAGIDAAVNDMMASLSGQFVNEDQGKNDEGGGFSVKWIALIIVIIFVLIILFGGGSGGQTYNSGGSSGMGFLAGMLAGNLLGGGRGGGGGDSGGSGGFGGFGGGDFGGGGAGGDW